MSMMPNILNTIIGLYLAYVAIFIAPTAGQADWVIAVLGALIVVLAILTRRSDYSGWQSTTNIALGSILLVLTLVESVIVISPLVSFWVELWIGLAVATFALWAALYHPERKLKASDST